MDYKRIAVLSGGFSAEKEVSKKSADNIAKILDKMQLSYKIIDPQNGLTEQLSEYNPDVVINMLHGTYGEDGAVQGLLEVMGIPYTHSGILSSAIGLNKEYTKNILHDTGIHMAKSYAMTISEFKELITSGKKHPLSFPYVLKPVDQGSTVGIYIITENFDVAQLEGWEYGEKVMLEEFVGGIELTTAVLNNKVLDTMELRPKEGNIMDYKAKYTPNAALHIFPANAPKEIIDLTHQWAQIAHDKLGCRTVSRSDFKYDPSRAKGDQLFFLEINTHPGMTSTSLVPDLMKFKGVDDTEFIKALLNDARCDLKY